MRVCLTRRLALYFGLSCCWVLLVGFASAPAWAQTWYVGVLAPQGAAVAQQQWQPWLDGLERQLPEHDFVLVPLSLQSWRQELGEGRLDFALGPQVQFVTLPRAHTWRWLATVQTARRERPQAMEQVGSTLWVRADSPLHVLDDLRGRRIAAVDPQAFGGFMLGQKRLLDAGLKIERDYQIHFVGYPIGNTLQALHDGEVDAAIAPLCLMEEWQRRHTGAQGRFRALAVRPVASGCVSSTEVFPNWSLVAWPQVPDAVVTRVSALLFGTPSAAGPGWLPPVSSAATEEVLSALGRHPLQTSWQQQLYDWLGEHRWWVGAGLLLVAVSLVNYAWMSWLAYRRRRKLVAAYADLRERDRLMAHADRLNIAGEMAAGLAHELNQPLSAIRHYAEASLYQLQRIPTDAAAERQRFQAACRHIIAATERSRGIIQRLRQWMKPAQAHEDWVDVAALLARCREWLQWQQRSTALTVHTYTEVPRLYTVPGVVEQVLLNCLLNSQQQGARAVSVRVWAESDDRVRVCIEDDGGGFAAQMLAQPFVAFRSSKPQGLGLGLVICQRLLQRIGGDMMLANRDDGVAGARVTLILPFRQPATAADIVVQARERQDAQSDTPD